MDPDDPEVEHIYISFLDAALLFGGYLLYVLVCANMDRIVAFLGVDEEEDEMGAIGYGTIEDGKSLTSNMKISRMVCCPRCVYVHTPFSSSHLSCCIDLLQSIRDVPQMPYLHREPEENWNEKVHMTV